MSFLNFFVSFLAFVVTYFEPNAKNDFSVILSILGLLNSQE